MWTVFEAELGIPADMMCQLKRMYREVRAKVIGGEGISETSIPVTEGVK